MICRVVSSVHVLVVLLDDSVDVTVDVEPVSICSGMGAEVSEQ